MHNINTISIEKCNVLVELNLIDIKMYVMHDISKYLFPKEHPYSTTTCLMMSKNLDTKFDKWQ
jgi:hypothetical protein